MKTQIRNTEIDRTYIFYSISIQYIFHTCTKGILRHIGHRRLNTLCCRWSHRLEEEYSSEIKELEDYSSGIKEYEEYSSTHDMTNGAHEKILKVFLIDVFLKNTSCKSTTLTVSKSQTYGPDKALQMKVGAEKKLWKGRELSTLPLIGRRRKSEASL